MNSLVVDCTKLLICIKKVHKYIYIFKTSRKLYISIYRLLSFGICLSKNQYLFTRNCQNIFIVSRARE